MGDGDDRGPAEGEVKEKGVRPRQNAQRELLEQKGSVEVQSYAGNARSMHKMQMALGRTREGKKSSCWCWLQLFSAARLVGQGLHSQPFAALAGLLVLAGTTATGPLSGRWSTGLDGDPGAKQARKCEQGLGLPPGSQSPTFYPRLYLRRPVRRPFNLSCLRRYRGEEGERKTGCSVNSNCHWKGNRFERSLCYSPLRGRGLLVRQLQ